VPRRLGAIPLDLAVGRRKIDPQEFGDHVNAFLNGG
jgi:hypothetical protein